MAQYLVEVKDSVIDTYQQNGARSGALAVKMAVTRELRKFTGVQWSQVAVTKIDYGKSVCKCWINNRRPVVARELCPQHKDK